MQKSTVLYSTIQYRTVRYYTEQYGTIHYRTIRYTVQYGTIQYGTVQYTRCPREEEGCPYVIWECRPVSTPASPSLDDANTDCFEKSLPTAYDKFQDVNDDTCGWRKVS